MRTRLPLLLATIAVVLAVTSGTASAHGDEGELELTTFEQTGPTTVEVEVGIVYEGDEHLAEDASVTATLSGPDGATVGPVELTWAGAGSSLYAAQVQVPTMGDWSVAVTSTEPSGEVAGTLTVVEQADTTTTATEATTTVAPATTDEAPEPVTLDDELAADEDAADDGGVSPTVIVIACLVLAALVIGGAVLVARSRSGSDAAGPSTDA